MALATGADTDFSGATVTVPAGGGAADGLWLTMGSAAVDSTMVAWTNPTGTSSRVSETGVDRPVAPRRRALRRHAIQHDGQALCHADGRFVSIGSASRREPPGR